MKAGSKSAKLAAKRVKRHKVIKVAKPGCQPQFEDMRITHNSSHLKSQPDRTPAPKVVSSLKVPRSEVRDRVMSAMRTVRALPDKERRFFVQTSSSPDYVREYIDAYNSTEEIFFQHKPTPAEVSDCLTALSWVRHLDKKEWQILWWRSFELSFGLIAKYIGRSDETARKRYEEAVTDAWIAANGF